MPFTPSHVAAILPFVRTPLAPAALAIGAMAPDLPYFLPVFADRDLTHSLLGVPTIDLLVGGLAFVLWLAVLRAPVLDYSPRWLRERMDPQARWRVRGPVISVLLAVAAIELGILTHLLLDLVTHEGGWIETVAPWTSDMIGTFSVANIIHAVVSAVTGVIVVLWVRGWAGRTPRTPRASRLGDRERLATWLGLLGVLAAVGLVWWGRGIAVGRHPLDPNLMGASFFVAVAVTLGLAALCALVWRLRKVF